MVQHQEISRQKNEIASQARILQQQNDQLEKHHNFRNKIFTIISHDLRAPFNSVRGLLDLLQSQCLSANEITNVFGLLGRDIDATAAMLNNLLAWSRAQLKGSNINWQSVNLQQLAADNIHLADAQAALKNIRIRNEVPPHLMAFTDQERLSFVLRNLLANAMKFTFVNGEIKLQAREKDGKVEIAVSDNGQGISSKNIARLFTEERFSTPGTSHEKGTGLGLMLSKEFIETLKGDITVESRLEQGSVFRVLLPSGESPAVALEMAYLACH
jgi:signal transduction histidine kinase